MRTLNEAEAAAQWLRERVRGALHCDSRRLQPGDGLIAWPGASTDGRRFVAAALQAGASAALVEHDGVAAFGFDDERVLAVPGLKALAGPIASAFCAEPSAALDVVAITGTNGKTSTAWWTAQLLSALGRPCALVGTLGIGRAPVASGAAAALQPTGLTTPDPVLLQTGLRRLLDQGMQACAIETSSIGLAQGRLNGTRVKVAVFTNFTQDHLDFHASMADYWSAKATLFDWPGLVSAVLNLDDPQGVALASSLAQRGLDLWTVGIETAAGSASTPPARLFAHDLLLTDCGLQVVIGERSAAGTVLATHAVGLPLPGRYNVSNLLCALAAARALGVPLSDAVRACGALTPVPGRMEQVPAARPGQPLVLVDYAHTPDALEKALQTLQPLAQRRGGALWAVLGCGGERDPGKRPLMAAVAERLAQHLVLTSDNPRSEDPQAILRQMLAGLAQPDGAQVQADRAAAIAYAVWHAGARDVVLVAGKGHEEYQEVMGVKKPFSDLAQAQAALQQRRVSRAQPT